LIRWYDDAGKMQSKTMHGTANEADEECRRMEQDLNDGSLGRRRKIHWLDFCQRYLDDLKGCRRPRTVDDYKKVLEVLTAEYRPERPDEFTPHRLREFVRLQTDGRSPATRNKLIRTLRAIFGWAVPEYLKDNPARRVKFANEPERDRRTLTPDELAKVFKAADLRGRAVLLLGACCGLRREEISVLRWQDVEPAAGRVHVKNSEWHTTKSGQQRSVLMPPALATVLSQLKAKWKSQFVFPNVYQSYRELPVADRKRWSQRYQDGRRRGLGRDEARRLAWHGSRHCQQLDRPIDPDRLTDLVPRLVKRAGLTHCTAHDLRRTFCTYLAACGTDVLAAQKLAGHSSPAVTAKNYVQPVLEMLNSQKQLPYWNVESTPETSLKECVA
jgi:integrase